MKTAQNPIDELTTMDPPSIKNHLVNVLVNVQNKLAQLQNLFNKTRTQNQETKTKHSEVQQQMPILKNSISQFQFAMELASNKGQLMNIPNKLAQLQNMLNKTFTKNQQTNTEHSEVKQQVQTLKHTVRVLVMELSSNISNLAIVKSELTLLLNLLNEIDTQNQQTKIKQSEVQRQIRSLHTSISQRYKEFARNNSHLFTAQNDLTRLQNLLDEIQQIIMKYDVICLHPQLCINVDINENN